MEKNEDKDIKKGDPEKEAVTEEKPGKEQEKENETHEYADLGLEEIPVEEPKEERPKGLMGFLKTRKPDFWYRVLIGICMAVFVFAVVNLVMIYVEYGKAEKSYGSIEDEFVTYVDDLGDTEVVDDISAGETGAESGEETADGEPETKKGYKFSKLNVDFDKLKKKNSDVVGWIQFEGFYLSYPIVKDPGNNYYLTHTVEKKANSSGAIYIPKQNKSDFSDTNTIIFGHNMKNGTMFGLLGRYKEKAFFKLNQYFYIYTPKGEKRYQIFSVYVGDENGIAYTIYGAKNDDYGKFLENLKKNSMYDTGVSVSKENSIVTLSTCVSNDKTKRLIVHAKQVK